MQIFCIFCFVESSAISLNLCNNVNTACGDAQAGSFFCCLKKTCQHVHAREAKMESHCTCMHVRYNSFVWFRKAYTRVQGRKNGQADLGQHVVAARSSWRVASRHVGCWVPVAGCSQKMRRRLIGYWSIVLFSSQWCWLSCESLRLLCQHFCIGIKISGNTKNYL